MEIEPEELKALLEERPEAILLVDVRQPDEHAYCCIPSSRLIPWPELPWRASELNPRAEIVLYCYQGVRSALAAAWLAELGFERVRILRGGIRAWAARIDPSLPQYGAHSEELTEEGRIR
ncbi:MAG: rhodanese-like domain-containing protein [Blastocatellia bacterium]|nr:rhodanese-like domain-containing protein [Blastocatellia bacterium]MCS7156778.1 rhodanese-like domain-containing protein [Blastocatellia bacterium]MCX7752736.1 rhodanese-like domain-containing protein [Blastocatellia bacterium]MDW8167468.1 rhodanese-like domain-containing protein [Acidobacteriota bacterium]MDW8256815.1 rhodanese-like domain-containing protein [Acidobacteriota bacterium]